MLTKPTLTNISLAAELSAKMRFALVPSTIPYEHHEQIQKWLREMVCKAEENAEAYAENYLKTHAK